MISVFFFLIQLSFYLAWAEQFDPALINSEKTVNANPSKTKDGSCQKIFSQNNPYHEQLSRYAFHDWLQAGEAPTKELTRFVPSVGVKVANRDSSGRPLDGVIRVLSDNPGNQIAIIADYNDWGRKLHPADFLHPIEGTPYFEGKIRQLHEGMEYRLLLNGRQVIDPSAVQYTSSEQIRNSRAGDPAFLNSIFYDLEAMPHQTLAPLEFSNSPILITEQGIYELAAKYKGGPASKAETYKFIATSGLIDEIAKRGYTHVEFLPLNSSIDGDDWRRRYQVFGFYGPDSRYGTPEDLRLMIQEFHKKRIGVILDVVWGHYPFKGNEGLRNYADVGIHHFRNQFGRALFGDNLSEWGTYRFDYRNPFVKIFLIEGTLNMLKHFGFSGLRVDNVDGIRGEPGGNDFLKEASQVMRSYAPHLLMIGEMFKDQSSALAANRHDGVGFHVANDVEFFDFVQTSLRSYDHEIDMQRLENFLSASWRYQRPIVERWVTNHDEAANPRAGASGDYLATLIHGGDPIHWHYVINKTKAWGSLGALLGGFYLDMLQMRFLQEGNFNSNPILDWSVLQFPSQRAVDDYFSHLFNTIKALPAFAGKNLHPYVVNHIDNANKVISLLRVDWKTGKKYHAVINLGSHEVSDYRFGVNDDVGKSHSIIVDSDRSEFFGTGRLKNLLPDSKIIVQAQSLHGKNGSLSLPLLPAYGVLLIAPD